MKKKSPIILFSIFKYFANFMFYILRFNEGKQLVKDIEKDIQEHDKYFGHLNDNSSYGYEHIEALHKWQNRNYRKEIGIKFYKLY